jgi:hypothetical protein
MSNADTANWIYAMADTALLKGHMAAAYPKGVNVSSCAARVETRGHCVDATTMSFAGAAHLHEGAVL